MTIQRLIHHHSGSSKSTNDRRESRSRSHELEPESSQEPMELPDREPSSDQLPKLDLDVTSRAVSSAQDRYGVSTFKFGSHNVSYRKLAFFRSADFSEEENESDVSE